MIDLLAVGAGGFLGAAGRYMVGRVVTRFWRGDFPLGTFIVNVLGSFALGLLAAHPYFAASLFNGSVRMALGLGFMGSFTTFSTFMYESFTLARRNRPWTGVFYVFSSVAVGLLLAWLAIYLL
ncbi:fluoride efflux transporter CrcB [Desulfallas sp. Bu1-1]|uniref:fluoride efflux transporter CrcB n=1 Tax=Desulfallas sp. Bu1-1 TaxID=2787620 RepID=UPI00189E4C68|nr:fluoride efflux transporter CrcB [Desulfallas sp. Bu1-1]MBF7082541.1 fluoride efflux transporter CrcB [Desulfallas sp. Bu1-1]